jgi:uncharacterized protein YgiB involved in biofilm formation
MFIQVLKTQVVMCVVTVLLLLPAELASAELAPDAHRWISSTVFFENANACMWAGVASRICQSGYSSAYRQHVRIAPAYHAESDCEADFVLGECFAGDVSHLWMPWFSGFALITHARLVSPSSYSLSERHLPIAKGDRSWWQQLQGATQTTEHATEVRYFSEPLYWERDHQGGQRLTSLREKLRNGDRLAKAFSRRPPVKPGSALWTRQLARVFEPQRLIDVAAP